MNFKRDSEYTVVKSYRHQDSPSTLILTLASRNDKHLFNYKPGQYAAISFVSKHRPTPVRCFSITSSPTEKGALQFGIKVKGLYTKTAADALSDGAKVIVEGPFGNFIFHEQTDRSVLMIAGGIGVAPFMGMLRYAVHKRLHNDLMLLYSCHSQDDIPFLNELLQLKAANHNIKLVFVISDGAVDKLLAAGVSVLQGHIDAQLLNTITSSQFDQRKYFVCGPEVFMAVMKKNLESRGVTSDNIITEEFTQGQHGPKKLSQNFPLQIYGLTGLSLLLGSSTIMMNDVAKTYPNTTIGVIVGQNQTSSSNSRQNQVSQTITVLQSDGTTKSTTVTRPTKGSSSSGNNGNQNSTNTGNKGTSSGSTPPPSPSPSPSPSPTPSPSPSPTSSPSPVPPSLSFGASATTITKGQSTTLSWSIAAGATDPVTCSASGAWSGSKATNGSQSVSPSGTTTYTLSCSNSAGNSGKSVTVTVNPACVSTPSHPC